MDRGRRGARASDGRRGHPAATETKRLLRAAFDRPLPIHLADAASTVARTAASADASAGIARFAASRPAATGPAKADRPS